PSTLGLVAVGPDLINIIIGEEFSISNHLLTLIIIATFINGVKSQYYDLRLQISAKTKYFFYPALVAIIVNVILNYYFLKTYGIEGAALSTVIAFLVALIISGIYSQKNYKVKLSYLTLLKIVVTTTIMYIVINKINYNIENVNLILNIKITIRIIYKKKNYKIKLSYLNILKIVVTTTIMYIVINQINYDIESVNLILKITIGIFVYVLFTIIFNTLKIRTNILEKLRSK